MPENVLVCFHSKKDEKEIVFLNDVTHFENNCIEVNEFSYSLCVKYYVYTFAPHVSIADVVHLCSETKLYCLITIN